MIEAPKTEETHGIDEHGEPVGTVEATPEFVASEEESDDDGA
jgi:hypothetical protein